jgi:hypothetical protein
MKRAGKGKRQSAGPWHSSRACLGWLLWPVLTSRAAFDKSPTGRMFVMQFFIDNHL